MTRCPICRTEFKRQRMSQKVCGAVDCAIEQGRRDKIKADRTMRNKVRERKEAAKTRAQHLRETQTAVNALVRERDRDLPCISCGRYHRGQWHAGHYLSTGARPGLRFDPRNIHKQCQPCNTHLSGNLINYRIGLIAKIGLQAVEELEADTTIRKYSIDDLKGIRAAAKVELRRLKAVEVMTA